MTITESRLKDGLLTIGTTPQDFSCQVTNARINSSYSDDGDPLETLCGDEIPAGRKLDQRALAGTFVQDWTAGAASITDYVWDHDLEEVAFEYTPNTAGPTLTGTCRLEVPAETYGGDVNTRITSDFEWAIIGDVTRTPAAGALMAGASSSASDELRLMSDARVEVEGLSSLVRSLKRAGVDISELKDAHTRAGQTVAAEASRRAPRLTGALAASVRATKTVGRARVQVGRSSVPYAAPIHWGWPARDIPPRPFASEAAQATEPQWTRDYLRDVEAALAKVKGI